VGAAVSQTKEAQRAELHKTIWRIANDVRGSVDGWDFKSYVLGMLFYRFISENLTEYLNEQEREAGAPDFDYANITDADAEFGRAETVREKGFYILPSQLFANVRKHAAQDENLNETLEAIFKSIEGSATGTDSEDDFKGLFDDLEVNSQKLGNTVAKRNEKLVKLLDAIGDLNLGAFNDHTIDSFGDAYEYLMTMYASSAGKSGGEFFTPQEVSELLARIVVVGKLSVNKVYDPACGSGSLLLKLAKVLGKDNVRQGFFGQEINLTTFNLARINMFLHDINYEKFDIAHGDTLTDPQHWDHEPFEAIVSNPPYSIQWAGDSNPLLINDPRFAPAGVLAPKTKADLAFTMHMLSWLAVSGTAAIVEFPGVLYRGGAEQKIRKYLIDNNYVDAVIQLPPNLFFGVSIATCILVLKKSKKDNAILFINASDEFVKAGNKNKLTEAHQQKIFDAFIAREDIEHFAQLVPSTEIADNRYSLAVSSYVEAKDTSEVVDIASLNARIAEIVAHNQELREQIDASVADMERPS
jgi:type I restriction enzyme M protein